MFYDDFCSKATSSERPITSSRNIPTSRSQATEFASILAATLSFALIIPGMLALTMTVRHGSEVLEKLLTNINPTAAVHLLEYLG
jgi:hypothetical protein